MSGRLGPSLEAPLSSPSDWVSSCGGRRFLVALVAVGLTLGVLAGVFIVETAHSSLPAKIPAKATQLVPAQGDQLYTFSACTAPDGSSCLSQYQGGIDTPLAVGTTVVLEFFTSAFCTTPITGNINWEDGSSVQSQTISSGPCECEFGPFTHTFNSAGDFDPQIYDSCDGSESLGTISVSGVGDIFSFDSLLIIFGAILGLAAVIGALVSMRRLREPVRPPPSSVSASIESVQFGTISDAPVGPRSTTIPSAMEIPPQNALGGRFPAWALDYRTTPYRPNPLIQGWAEYRQQYQLWLNRTHGGVQPPPDPPTWAVIHPPTGYPGTFYQARIDPNTAQWRWWNPVDGTFL